MKIKSRIVSVLTANHLDESITSFKTFHLSELDIVKPLNFQIHTNLRLGHMVEKIVSEMIKASTNYTILYENIQIQKDKNTIGELDFIIQNLTTNQIIHLELAYKFYLYDPTISSESIYNWIGPNRKDSLQEKLEKLKNKQFPLLYNIHTKEQLSTIDIDKITQKLCLLIALFIPYTYKGNFPPILQKAVKGYYINFETFLNFDHSEKTYHLPNKKEWGITPSENEVWSDLETAKKEIQLQLQVKHAPLCWQKHNDSYECFFVVWW